MTLHRACERVDRAIKHNPLDIPKRELLERCGCERSTYYYGVKHGCLTLEMVVRLAKEGALTDEQILSIFK